MPKSTGKQSGGPGAGRKGRARAESAGGGEASKTAGVSADTMTRADLDQLASMGSLRNSKFELRDVENAREQGAKRALQDAGRFHFDNVQRVKATQAELDRATAEKRGTKLLSKDLEKAKAEADFTATELRRARKSLETEIAKTDAAKSARPVEAPSTSRVSAPQSQGKSLATIDREARAARKAAQEAATRAATLPTMRAQVFQKPPTSKRRLTKSEMERLLSGG